MAKRKKTSATGFVASSNILIEGKHFDAGAAIKGVSDEEIAKCANLGRVVTEEEFLTRGLASTSDAVEAAEKAAAEIAAAEAAAAAEKEAAEKAAAEKAAAEIAAAEAAAAAAGDETKD